MTFASCDFHGYLDVGAGFELDFVAVHLRMGSALFPVGSALAHARKKVENLARFDKSSQDVEPGSVFCHFPGVGEGLLPLHGQQLPQAPGHEPCAPQSAAAFVGS